MSELEDLLLFQIRAAKLPIPEREFRFDSSRRWRVDLCWIDRKLAVEVEGGTWVAGRHNRPQSMERDMEKYNSLSLAGFQLLRFSGGMIKDGRALHTLEQALHTEPLPQLG